MVPKDTNFSSKIYFILEFIWIFGDYKYITVLPSRTQGLDL